MRQIIIMLDILVATNNDHKLHEYNVMFNPLGIHAHSPKEYGIVDNPDENGTTFEANSLIKAESLAKYSKMPIIADDSGICVKSLNNFPGIYSARFAKECGGNANANLELIKRAKATGKMDAEFVCVITLLNVEDKPIQFKGICPGYLLDEPHGNGGFGYDPIFYSTEGNIALGLASEDIKNKYSHRSKAISQLVEYLKKRKLI